MEFALILIVIAIAVSLLTGNVGILLFGMSGLILLTSGFLVVIFSICLVFLLTSKWKDATFAGIDLPSEKSKFKVAFYEVDGEEIPCLFPEEGVFRNKLYREDRTYRVLVNRRLGKVFDRYAIITCVMGLTCGLLFGTVMIALYY